jgi:hypothetical protein
MDIDCCANDACKRENNIDAISMDFLSMFLIIIYF